MNPTPAAHDRARAPRVVRIALAQVNPVVGDLPGNTKKVIEFIERARSQGAELVAFPELVLTGYPPEDLLLRPEFIEVIVIVAESIIGAGILVLGELAVRNQHIVVAVDHEPFPGRDGEEREHMAGRQGSHEGLLGVYQRGVAPV